ncbi:MAG: hypothetical protein D6805_08885, partial [Planctomycetota bacterium]
MLDASLFPHRRAYEAWEGIERALWQDSSSAVSPIDSQALREHLEVLLGEVELWPLVVITFVRLPQTHKLEVVSRLDPLRVVEGASLLLRGLLSWSDLQVRDYALWALVKSGELDFATVSSFLRSDSSLLQERGIWAVWELALVRREVPEEVLRLLLELGGGSSSVAGLARDVLKNLSAKFSFVRWLILRHGEDLELLAYVLGELSFLSEEEELGRCLLDRLGAGESSEDLRRLWSWGLRRWGLGSVSLLVEALRLGRELGDDWLQVYAAYWLGKKGAEAFSALGVLETCLDGSSLVVRRYASWAVEAIRRELCSRRENLVRVL